MFSGVAPLPCIIAKNTKAKEVYGIELNKAAHKFAEENVKINKLSNVILKQGDVKSVVPRLKKKFDRIIMPLPKGALDYLPLALKCLKPKGTVHLYIFAEEKGFKNIVKEYKKRFKSVKLAKAGNYSPNVYRICLDLRN